MPLNPPPTIDANLGLITLPVSYGGGRAALVTLAVDCGAHDLATAQDAVDDFQANVTTLFGATWNTSVVYGPATIRVGDGSTVPVEATAAIGQQLGTGSTNFVSANIAALVKKSTGLGGKKNRGRTYWPFVIDEAHIVEPGEIDGTVGPIIQGRLTTFLNQLSTDGTPMVIANKVFSAPLPPHYVTAIHKGPAVTSYTLEVVLATQRRRLRS